MAAKSKYQATYRAATTISDETIQAMKKVMEDNDYSFSEFVNHIWEENQALRDGIVPSDAPAQIEAQTIAAEVDLVPVINKIDEALAETIEAIEKALAARAASDDATEASSKDASEGALTKDDAEKMSQKIIEKIIEVKEAEVARLDLMLERIEEISIDAKAAPASPVIVENSPVAVASPMPTIPVAIAEEPAEGTEDTADEGEVPEDVPALDVVEDSILDPAVEIDAGYEDEDGDGDDEPSNLTDDEADEIVSLLASELWEEEMGEDTHSLYDEADALVDLDDAAIEEADAILADFAAAEVEIVDEEAEDVAVMVEDVTAEAEPANDEVASDPTDEPVDQDAGDDAITIEDGEIDDDVLLGLELLGL